MCVLLFISFYLQMVVPNPSIINIFLYIIMIKC